MKIFVVTYRKNSTVKVEAFTTLRLRAERVKALRRDIGVYFVRMNTIKLREEEPTDD